MTVKILTGDCIEVLRNMPPCFRVNTCVTSPPYWGLRDYGHAGQIGLEETPDAYVARLVAVFREVREKLADDGTLWLNLGDSYGTAGNRNGLDSSTLGGSKTYGRGADVERPDREQRTGLKPKDLVGIPWRVAFALQADGWYLRSDIIWSKPNPMPESVTDRPTKAHEYIFLLSKSASYYYDADAIAEPVSASMLAQIEQGYNGAATKDYAANGVQDPSEVKARILRGRVTGRGEGKEAARQVDGRQPQRSNSGGFPAETTRNKRTVWTVTTKPFSGAHFATFPPDLIEPCIKAGCPEGGTVLDPFGGAGTTGLVADRLQRNALLIELNPQYADMARERIQNDSPLFTEVA